MVSYSEAYKIIRDEVQKLKLHTEEVDLLNSLNRILAEDVYADTNLPPFDNSAMDGYTVKFSPSRKQWKMIGEISAGNFNILTLDEDSAVLIMTGSKLPANTSAVIPVEDVIAENGYVKLADGKSIKENQHIRYKGGDLTKGVLALERNQVITSNKISLLGACGKARVKVYRKLKFGVLATGDELVDISSRIFDDKIRGTNLYSIISAVTEFNMEAVNFGFVKDDKEHIREKLSEAFDSDIDILLTTGGVSVGKYDYLKELLIELGTDIKFWKVKIKPGKPLIFGVVKKDGRIKFVVGLPGNPVSSYVNFMVFIKPAVQELFGIKDDKTVKAELTESVSKNDDKRNFLRGYLEFNLKKGQYFVRASEAQSSADMTRLANANCLIVIEEKRINPQKGEEVQCIII
ncbi:MAG: molybdopterin molybdenumtransferase MoeA [Ignavibacteria bacterium RBG_16_34_14]|nr:MAG: molybdopterin molybdenumtransferase MoeA [Ignavibacteria bacterium RBG_16_34_14]